jgi:hypothetical protein
MRVRRVRVAVLMSGAALGAACAHVGTFDRNVHAGHWQEAAAVFRADSSLQRNANALRLAARIHATPDSATWDPDRALDLFERARVLSPRAVPEADLRAEAMLRFIVRERAARGAQAIVLRDSIDKMARQADQLRVELVQLRETDVAHESERAVLERMVSRLETDVHDRETQMATLRTELDRLKEIDLARAAHPRPE